MAGISVMNDMVEIRIGIILVFQHSVVIYVIQSNCQAKPSMLNDNLRAVLITNRNN